MRPELAPDQSQYDASDSRLRAAAQLLQDALNAPTVEKEEALWCVCVHTLKEFQMCHSLSCGHILIHMIIVIHLCVRDQMTRINLPLTWKMNAPASPDEMWLR